MKNLVIDGMKVEVDDGSTVLDAARKAGKDVPTLCHLRGTANFTSCMVCVVKEAGSGRLIPACSASAENGMSIETGTAEVLDARRAALDLLLSEHIGDCEGPCRRGCPARMDIPLMLRQIASGDLGGAIATVKQHIPLPAVLGRICPAPCEKICRRAQLDGAVEICLLKRFVADVDLATAAPYMPPRKPPTGKRVTIIGAGPAGLSAAYYLLCAGHACTIYDDQDEPGGNLRIAVPESQLPRDVLDAEIEIIRRLGAEFVMKTLVGRDVHASQILRQSDAIVLTSGRARKSQPDYLVGFGAGDAEHPAKVDPRTMETGIPRVFAGGDAVQPGKMAVRAVAHGRLIALSIDQMLRNVTVVGNRERYDSRIGKLEQGEAERFLDGTGFPPGAGGADGTWDSVRSASRCLRCDCRKSSDCTLRKYADEYGCRQARFAGAGRKRFERIASPVVKVTYEPGKCIKCGICVRITERAGEKLGLTFIGRGFDVRIGVPFNEALGAALEKTAADCVKACPTAALSWE